MPRLWAETDDIRKKLLTIGEDLADAGIGSNARVAIHANGFVSGS